MTTLAFPTHGFAPENSTHLDSRLVNADPDSSLPSLSSDLLHSHHVEDLSRNADYILSQRINAPVTNELRAPTAEEIDLLERVIHQSLHPELIPVDGRRYAFPNLEVTTYESEYIPPLNPDWKIQVIQSPMGTDKTGKLCRYIKETKTPSATFTSPRRTFTRSCTARFRDEGIPVKSYLEEKITDKDDFVIISAESLRQLKTISHLLSMDEVTSNLAQMNSGLHKNLNDNQQMLIMLIRTSPKIVFMDADIDTRALMLLYLLRPNEIIHYQINIIKKRTDWVAYQLDEITMYNQLSHDLKSGKNVKIICGSEKYGEKYLEPVIRSVVGADNYRFYHSKGGRIDPRELDDVNLTWSKLRVLMFTSIVTQGLNFTDEHFHSIYIFGHSQGCPIREVKQMMGRVRNLVNTSDEAGEPKKVYYWNQTRRDKLPETCESLKKQIQEHLLAGNLDMVKSLGAENKQLYVEGTRAYWRLKNDYWTWLSIQNQLECNRSRNNYDQLFVEMLESQGIAIGKTRYVENDENTEYIEGVRTYLKERDDQVQEFKAWKRVQDTEWKDKRSSELSNAVWLSNFKQITAFKSKRQNGEATTEELTTLRKSELLQHIDPQHRETFSSDGNKLSLLSDNLTQLLNCQMVRDWTSRDVALYDIRKHNYNQDPIPELSLPQFEGISWLCQILGLNSILDRETVISSEILRQRTPFVIQNIPLLDARFKVPHQEVKDYAGVLRYVNSRLRTWGGCSLIQRQRKYITVNGKRVEVKYYQIRASDGLDEILQLMTTKKYFLPVKSPD